MVAVYLDCIEVTCDAAGCKEVRDLPALPIDAHIVRDGGALVRSLEAEGWAFASFDACACPTHAAPATAEVR